MLVAAGGGVARAAEAAPPPPRVPVPQQGTGELIGIGTELSSNDSGMPPGVVNGPCTPSPSHPYPVVLVHGTFANENFSWQTLAPLLSDAGYCVFGLNYGATSWTTTFGDHSYRVDYVEHSAQELESFIVGTVLPDTFEPADNTAGYGPGTHPAQIDMVGHSRHSVHRWRGASALAATSTRSADPCYSTRIVASFQKARRRRIRPSSAKNA